MEDCRLVMIVWEDTSIYNGGWSPLADEEAGDPLICRSVGWIYDESERSILLVPHVHDENERLNTVLSGNGHVNIPRRAVVEMIDLLPQRASAKAKRKRN